MLLAEYLELESNLKTDIQSKYDKAVALFESGEYGIEPYLDLGIKEPKIHYINNTSLLRYVSKRSDNINDMSIEDLRELLDEFEEEYTNSKLINKSYITNDEDLVDGYIETLGYMFYGYELDEDTLKAHTQYALREMIADLLDPKKEGINKRSVDCPMMQLFLEGTIDWLTLQKIVYSNCEL